MTPLRRLMLVLWAAVAVVGLLTVVVFGDRLFADPPARPQPVSRPALPGGDFTMTDHQGQPFTQAELRGRSSLVFFGFTFCPDVCPTTLTDMTGWLEQLGSDADRLQAIFVSVDPERDSPYELRRYLEAFDPRIRALTGAPAQLRATAAHFGASYRRVEIAGGYTMDHTALVYLLDAAGRFFGTIDFHEDRAVALAKLRRLLAEGG